MLRELYVSFVGSELRERGAASLFERGWRCCRKGSGGRRPLGERGSACGLRHGRSKRLGVGIDRRRHARLWMAAAQALVRLNRREPTGSAWSGAGGTLACGWQRHRRWRVSIDAG